MGAAPGVCTDETVSRSISKALCYCCAVAGASQVDLVLSARLPQYVRTCPVYHQTCQGKDDSGAAKAPVYVTLGNGGALVGALLSTT